MSLTPAVAETLRQALARDHGARMIMIHQPVHPYVSREGWIAELAEQAPNVIGVSAMLTSWGLA